MGQGRPKTHPLSLMSRAEIIAHVETLYRERGPSILTFDCLRKAGVYFHLNHKGIKHGELIDAIGARQDYEIYKITHFTKKTKSGIQRRWSWSRVLSEAKAAKETHGHLPPAQWFQQNSMGSLVAAVYNFGKSWENLRDEIGCFVTSDFVQSRNGLRWKSHPEASLSNFLHARGIKHKVGVKYPERIADVSDLTFAYYDLHFEASDGRWIDVEIWGDKPNGHDEEGYARKRQIKEDFNRSNERFLGIGYRDCFEEKKLTAILRPYIGEVEPYIFDKPADAILYSTHWSNADELIAFCRELADKQPDKIFPTESWLRKRGKERHRDGVPYNTLSVYIKKWIGGVRKLRTILGQSEHSNIVWNRDVAIHHYREFYTKHGFTASQAKSSKRRACLEKKTILYAQSICHAVETYAGGVVTLNAELGIEIDNSRKWSEEAILEKIRLIYDKYGLLPNQITGARPEYLKVLAVTDDDASLSKNLVGIIPEYFERASEAYKKLGIKTTDIRIAVKRWKTEHRIRQTIRIETPKYMG